MSRPQGKKRSATTEATRDSSSSSTSTFPQRATKKTRFVDPDEDPANFAEQVDSALEAPARKGGVKTEGYESDSSDDGEGVVFSRRGGGDGADDLGGDEDDMFSAAEKATPNDSRPDGDQKKGEKFMRLGDIEGQEFGAASGDDSSDGEEEDEPEDEDDAERRKKAGMGFELSSFNMREEMEEGKFTADGSYVRTYDPHGVHDRWMEGLSEKEIKLARRRKKQQDKLQKQKQDDEERELRESGGKEGMEKQLLPYLKKGESVLEALQRLGAQAKKKPKKNSKSAPDAMATDSPTKPPPKTDIELITHLASNIMALGDTDVYSKTYEELVRDVRRSGIVDQNWEPPSADVKFEYKWDIPGTDSSETFGPYSEEEMRAWYKASYFGPSGEKVKVRPTGGEWISWDDALG